MAERQVDSAPFGHVSRAKQATFQVAPRRVGRVVRKLLAPPTLSYEGFLISFIVMAFQIRLNMLTTEGL
jgi:hypothetical protein